MGSTGKSIEKFGQSVGGALGINPNTKMGKGGSFQMTKEGAAGEKEALQQLRDQIAGKAPSISELQYQKGLEDIIKQQQSATASARGVSNVGLLQREAMMQGQQAGLDLARESAAAKVAEQRGAQQALLNQAAAQRGVAQQSAAASLGAETEASKQRAGFLGNLGGGAASMMAMAMSDENMKEDIKPSSDSGNKMVESFMDALKSYTYEYKNKKNNGKENPDGKVTSVMAQDLEKSELGKQMVKESPEGKMVDYAQGMAPLFAAIAELNSRTKKLEGK